MDKSYHYYEEEDDEDFMSIEDIDYGICEDTDDELYDGEDLYSMVYHSFLGGFINNEIIRSCNQKKYMENVFSLVRVFSGYDIYDYRHFEYEILGDYYYFRELLFKIEAFIQTVYYILPNDIIMIILLDGYNNYIKFN